MGQHDMRISLLVLAVIVLHLQEAEEAAKAQRWERVKRNARTVVRQASLAPPGRRDTDDGLNAGQGSQRTRKASLDSASAVLPGAHAALCKHSSQELAAPAMLGRCSDASPSDRAQALGRSSSCSPGVSPFRQAVRMPRGTAKYAERGQLLVAQHFRRQPGERAVVPVLTREQRMHRCTARCGGWRHPACSSDHSAR